MFVILVDADACPVKDEVYAVAARYGIHVILVANAPIGTPPGSYRYIGAVAGEGADFFDQSQVIYQVY